MLVPRPGGLAPHPTGNSGKIWFAAPPLLDPPLVIDRARCVFDLKIVD